MAAKIDDESAARIWDDFTVTMQPNFAGSSRRVVTDALKQHETVQRKLKEGEKRGIFVSFRVKIGMMDLVDS